MAILVVDINEGFQPQTLEALEILRNCKTPFVVAATKIDRIHGWRVNENEPFQSTFAKQGERSRSILENKIYEIVGNSLNWDLLPSGTTGSAISSGMWPSSRSPPIPARG